MAAKAVAQRVALTHAWHGENGSRSAGTTCSAMPEGSERMVNNMAEYITKQQVIELVKRCEVIIGCTGAAVLTREIERIEATEVIVNKTDYTGKCGTCQWFERNGQERHGWCHKRPYGNYVVCDRKHPYMVVTMSRKGCQWFSAKE